MQIINKHLFQILIRRVIGFYDFPFGIDDKSFFLSFQNNIWAYAFIFPKFLGILARHLLLILLMFLENAENIFFPQSIHIKQKCEQIFASVVQTRRIIQDDDFSNIKRLLVVAVFSVKNYFSEMLLTYFYVFNFLKFKKQPIQPILQSIIYKGFQNL